MTTETTGPVERWVREVFDGTTRSLDDTYAQARQHDKRTAALVEALEFYADPKTYAGIVFFAADEQQSCGDFVEDMPGKRARVTLAAFKEEA